MKANIVSGVWISPKWKTQSCVGEREREMECFCPNLEEGTVNQADWCRKALLGRRGLGKRKGKYFDLRQLRCVCVGVWVCVCLFVLNGTENSNEKRIIVRFLRTSVTVFLPLIIPKRKWIWDGKQHDCKKYYLGIFFFLWEEFKAIQVL